jgi:hypothetical protein
MLPVEILEMILLSVVAQLKRADPDPKPSYRTYDLQGLQLRRYAKLLQLQTVCRQFKLALDGLKRRRALRPYFDHCLMMAIFFRFEDPERTVCQRLDTAMVERIFKGASDAIGQKPKDLVKICRDHNGGIYEYQQPPSVIRFLIRHGDYCDSQDNLNALVKTLIADPHCARLRIIRDVVYPEALLMGANAHKSEIEQFLFQYDGTSLDQWDPRQALDQLWRETDDDQVRDRLYEISGLVKNMISRALKFACENTSIDRQGAGGIVKLMIEENLDLPKNAIALLCGTGLPFYPDSSLAELVAVARPGMGLPASHRPKIIENLVTNGCLETAIVLVKRMNQATTYKKLWREVLGHANRDELAERLRAAGIPCTSTETVPKLHESKPGYHAALVTMARIVGLKNLDVCHDTRDLVRTHLSQAESPSSKNPLLPHTVKRSLDGATREGTKRLRTEATQSEVEDSNAKIRRALAGCKQVVDKYGMKTQSGYEMSNAGAALQELSGIFHEINTNLPRVDLAKELVQSAMMRVLKRTVKKALDDLIMDQATGLKRQGFPEEVMDLEGLWNDSIHSVAKKSNLRA